MKKTGFFPLLLAAGMVVTSNSALAGNASRAVYEMTLRDQRALDREQPGVDLMTTGSVKSEDRYDARGVVIPNAEVTLGAGIAAQIEVMPFKAGQEFRKGESLVVFNCVRPRADLRGAEASLSKAVSDRKSVV